MGKVAFQWGDNQLTLLQNRESFDSWETEPVAWDAKNQILRGLPENNFGTWCGISRRGRVAFLVNARFSENLSPSMFRPVDFLRGTMSPWDFAWEWSSSTYAHIMNMGLVYYMIVADINLKSMVFISRSFDKVPVEVHTEEVGFGVHTLSSDGLDSQVSEDLRMKTIFCEMIGDNKNKELPPLKEMAEKFMYEPVEAGETSASSSNISEGSKQKRAKALSTTALTVKPTKQVELYERYLENGEWKDHDFPFNLD